MAGEVPDVPECIGLAFEKGHEDLAWFCSCLGFWFGFGVAVAWVVFPAVVFFFFRVIVVPVIILGG